MRTLLLITAISMLITSACYGQVRASRAGTAEAMSKINRQRQGGIEASHRIAERKAEYKKFLESGRRLFGADELWTTGKGELSGTLAGKQPTDFKIGDWGCTGTLLEILSKVGDAEFLTVPKYNGSKVVGGMLNDSAEVVLIRGLDASKVTDGVRFILQHPVFIQETYTYTTAHGSQKTVLVLKLDEAQAAEKVAQARAAAAAKSKAEQAAADAKRQAAEATQKRLEAKKWRTWTTADGKYTVEAKFIKYAFGTLTLEKKDMTTVDVKLDGLCQEDQDFLKHRKTKSR